MITSDRAAARKVAYTQTRTRNSLPSLPLVLATLLLVLPTPSLAAHVGKIVSTSALFAINLRWGEPRASYVFVLFLIVLAASLVPALHTWNPMVVPATAFAVLACVRRDWFSAQRWLVRGRASPVTWLIFAVTIPSAAGALFSWATLAEPDLTIYADMIPGNGLGIVLAAAIVFSVFNAIAEEVVFRGVLWQALADTGLSTSAVLIIQAVAFGIMHLGGVPSGVAGVALATIYGLALGGIRHLSEGLLMPVVVHIFADLTIFLIVLKLGGGW